MGAGFLSFRRELYDQRNLASVFARLQYVRVLQARSFGRLRLSQDDNFYKKRGPRVPTRPPAFQKPKNRTYLISTLRGCDVGVFATVTRNTPSFISAAMLSTSMVSGRVNERVTLP